MKYLMVLSLVLVGCGQQYDTGPAGVSVTGTAYCSTGQCYSYLEDVCCPRSAPYACNGGCYSTLSAGESAGCVNYKTTCY